MPWLLAPFPPDWRAERVESFRHLRTVQEVFAVVQDVALAAHAGPQPEVTRRRRYPHMGLFVRLVGAPLLAPLGAHAPGGA